MDSITDRHPANAMVTHMLNTVAVRGYDVLEPTPGLDADTAARDPWGVAASFFGEPPSMVERQPIKPVPQGRSFASNAAFTPLHSDSQMFCGVSPHAQLMFCAKAAQDGGTTLLLDTYALLETIERDDTKLFRMLFTESRRIPFVFGDVVGPTVSWRSDNLVFTHSPMRPMREADEVAHRLQRFLSQASVIEVPVKDGQILVVDNHRMLHGRTAFTDESRRFTRLLVWRRSSFTRHIHFEALARQESDRLRVATFDQTKFRALGLGTWSSREVEWRRRIVLDMLQGVPPGVLAQRHGIPEPTLYVWRDAAVAAMDDALDE
jgi:hypothetical protein